MVTFTLTHKESQTLNPSAALWFVLVFLGGTLRHSLVTIPGQECKVACCVGRSRDSLLNSLTSPKRHLMDLSLCAPYGFGLLGVSVPALGCNAANCFWAATDYRCIEADIRNILSHTPEWSAEVQSPWEFNVQYTFGSSGSQRSQDCSHLKCVICIPSRILSIQTVTEFKGNRC